MKDIKFNLTKNMFNMLLLIIDIKEKLEDKSIKEKSKKKLENQFIKIREQFINEFQKNNIKQIEEYNKIKNAND